MASIKWTPEEAATFVFWAQLCTAAHPQIHADEMKVASVAAEVIAKIKANILSKGYEEVDQGAITVSSGLSRFQALSPTQQKALLTTLVAICISDGQIQQQEKDLLGVLFEKSKIDDQEELTNAARFGLQFANVSVA